MRLVGVLLNIDEADSLEKMLHPAEIESCFVEIIRVTLPTIEKTDPRGMPGGLKMRPVLHVNFHNAVDIRHRNAQFAPRRKYLKSTLKHTQSIIMREMLENVTGVDQINRVVVEIIKLGNIRNYINCMCRQNVHVAKSGQANIAATQMQSFGITRICSWQALSEHQRYLAHSATHQFFKFSHRKSCSVFFEIGISLF